MASRRKFEHLNSLFRFIFRGLTLLGHPILNFFSNKFWIQFGVSVSWMLFGFYLAHRLRQGILLIGYCYNIILILRFLGPSSMLIIGLLLEVTSLTHFIFSRFLSKAQSVKFSFLHLLLLVYNIQNLGLIRTFRKILVTVDIIIYILHWILKSASRQPQIRLKSLLLEKIPFLVIFILVFNRRFNLWLFQTDDSSFDFNIRFLFYACFTYICFLKTFKWSRCLLIYWVFIDDLFLISVIFCLSNGDRKPIVFLRVHTDCHSICARSYSKLWYVSNFNINIVPVVIIFTPGLILVLVILIGLLQLLFIRSFLCFWWSCWTVVIVARLIGVSLTIRVVSQMSCRLYTTHANLIYIVSLIH